MGKGKLNTHQKPLDTRVFTLLKFPVSKDARFDLLKALNTDFAPKEMAHQKLDKIKRMPSGKPST